MKKLPDILLITSDQHRGDTLGCAGHPCVRTPHLDVLAAQGIRFENAYADCPVCIPQRTTMVTGIESHVYGKPQYSMTYHIDRPREEFLGSLMTKASYQTQLIGKSHWHTLESFRAGFEGWLSQQYYRDFVVKAIKRPSFHTTGIGWNEMNPALSFLPAELYETDWMVDRCVEFLQYRDRTQPFFLWASLEDPHPPNEIHEPYYSMYDHDEVPKPVVPKWTQDERCPASFREHQLNWNSVPMNSKELAKARGVYYGKVTNLDHQLGRLFGKLRTEGLYDETLIIYSSDHGEALGDCGDMGKSSFMEYAANVPLIIKPHKSAGCQPGTVSPALVGWVDLLPTLCHVADVQPPADVTGRSLLPILMGQVQKVREEFHGQIMNNHMLHDGTYKYLYFADDGKELLFNTAMDRRDLQPLNHDHALLTCMRKKLIDHLEHEQHEHVFQGELVNLKKSFPTEAEMRAKHAGGLH